jgi:hypothetical protein
LTTEEILALADTIASLIAEATEPLVKRIKELEDRQRPPLMAGESGPELIIPMGVSTDTLRRDIDALTDKLSTFPIPKNGSDGKDGLDGKDGVDGKNGRDGVDGKPGEKGDPGDPGRTPTVEEIRGVVSDVFTAEMSRWELQFERRAMDANQRVIDRLPIPKDGRDGVNGKDGRDGIDISTFKAELGEDDRTLNLSFLAGEQEVKSSVVLPYPLHSGVHKAGQEYQRGDAVTFQGSTFLATRPTKSKPETDDSWRLIVKRGRDGKDGEKGAPGERGRDANAMTLATLR